MTPTLLLSPSREKQSSNTCSLNLARKELLLQEKNILSSATKARGKSKFKLRSRISNREPTRQLIINSMLLNNLDPEDKAWTTSTAPHSPHNSFRDASNLLGSPPSCPYRACMAPSMRAQRDLLSIICSQDHKREAYAEGGLLLLLSCSYKRPHERNGTNR